MTREQKLDQMLNKLENIYLDAKKLGLDEGTLKAIDEAITNVELDLRQEVYSE